MNLIVSIGTVDNSEDLTNCLTSIYSQTEPSFEFKVVVIFNGSPQDKIDRIIKKFPQIEYLNSKSALGTVRANNLVLKNYKARYMLLLDDDTLVHEETLSRMVAFMDNHPEVGISGCRTLNPDGSFQKSYGLDHNLKTELLHALNIGGFWPEKIYQDISKWKEVEWLNGSFLLIRHEAMEEVGVLDDFYYMQVHEPDWCYRIRKAGWKVAYVPDAEIVHVGRSHSPNTWFRKYHQVVRYHVNRFYFFKKHYGSLEVNLLRLIFLIGSFFRVVKYLGVYALISRKREEAAQKLIGYSKVIGLCLSRQPYKLPEEIRHT
jgi:GT2 family glycosyltransferase